MIVNIWMTGFCIIVGVVLIGGAYFLGHGLGKAEASNELDIEWGQCDDRTAALDDREAELHQWEAELKDAIEEHNELMRQPIHRRLTDAVAHPVAQLRTETAQYIALAHAAIPVSPAVPYVPELAPTSPAHVGQVLPRKSGAHRLEHAPGTVAQRAAWSRPDVGWNGGTMAMSFTEEFAALVEAEAVRR